MKRKHDIKSVNIAEAIAAKRIEKGISQGELAKFMGVSKPAVSKWESGQSYPDITFLPQLASYFDISIDELIGYEPQMEDADIRKLYVELSHEFATKPLDGVMIRCRDLIKKHYSCFPLLFQIAGLFANYGAMQKDEDEKTSVLTEAKELFARVKSKCDSIELRQLALYSEAACEMALGNSAEVITLLENEKRFTFQPSVEAMRSQSYLALGKTKEAKMALQESFLDSIVPFLFNMSFYLTICTDDIRHFEEVCRCSTKMIEIFDMKRVYPAATLSFYIAAATGYLTIGDTDKSLAMLEAYTEVATDDIFPLIVRSGKFFSLADELQERQQKELPFGLPDWPVDEQSTKQEMADAVIDNPTFSALADEPRFSAVVEKLKTMLDRQN